MFVTRDSLATKIAICEGMMRLCDVLMTSKHGIKEAFILRRGYEEKLKKLRAATIAESGDSCKNCQAESRYCDTREEAVEIWNRRVETDD